MDMPRLTERDPVVFQPRLDGLARVDRVLPARLGVDPVSLLVPAGLVMGVAFAWVQERLVLGGASVPLVAYVMPAALGLGLGAAFAVLVLGRRSAELRASVDALTHLRNRAALDRVLTDEVERSARYGGPFSVVVFDVDRFKGINDTHGHAAGDGVLLHIAETVGGAIRRTDTLGRWGGDEFVLVAPGIGASGGRTLAEKVCEAVASVPAPGGIAVTISVGVAHYVPGDSVASVLRRADEALYDAKRGGRNRAASTVCLRATGTHGVVPPAVT